MTAACEVTTTEWQGCYDDLWRDVIVDEAFAHPAKFSYGLINRIYQHCLNKGYLRQGDLVGDPFSGVGLGGLIAAYCNLRWVGVELEPRFCDLADQNFAEHAPRWRTLGVVRPMIIEGDSREFASLVRGCGAIVTSPPFVDQVPCQDKSFRLNDGRTAPPQGQDGYGQSEGQIGALKVGELAAVITSPPYADSVKGQHGETETAADSRDKRQTPGGSLGQSMRHGGYGCSDGNIGNLKCDGIVTSPPFVDSLHGAGGNVSKAAQGIGRSYGGNRGRISQTYGTTPGQIGNTKAETYWEAMRAVYEQCRLALKPGGVMCVVIKDHVKGGKRVPLCDQTLALLESLGFEPLERIRAMLIKETRQPGLFGSEVVETKERKSFFRRLAEKKGSPRIDWEEVLIVRATD